MFKMDLALVTYSGWCAIKPNSGSTWYESNRIVWHLNCMQIYYLCLSELFEIKLFDTYLCVNKWLFNSIVSNA